MPGQCLRIWRIHQRLSCGKTGQHGATEPDNSFYDFVRCLSYQDLLPGCQSDYRVRGNFHVLDEIGIDDKRDLIQARQADHKVYIGRYRREIYGEQFAGQSTPSGARGALAQVLEKYKSGVQALVISRDFPPA